MNRWIQTCLLALAFVPAIGNSAETAAGADGGAGRRHVRRAGRTLATRSRANSCMRGAATSATHGATMRCSR